MPICVLSFNLESTKWHGAFLPAGAILTRAAPKTEHWVANEASWRHYFLQKNHKPFFIFLSLLIEPARQTRKAILPGLLLGVSKGKMMVEGRAQRLTILHLAANIRSHWAAHLIFLWPAFHRHKAGDTQALLFWSAVRAHWGCYWPSKLKAWQNRKAASPQVLSFLSCFLSGFLKAQLDTQLNLDWICPSAHSWLLQCPMLHRKGTGLIPTTTLAALAFSTHVLDLLATHRKVDLLCKETSLFPEPAALSASCRCRTSKANQIAPQSWYSFSFFSIHVCIPMLHSQNEAHVR